MGIIDKALAESRTERDRVRNEEVANHRIRKAAENRFFQEQQGVIADALVATLDAAPGSTEESEIRQLQWAYAYPAIFGEVRDGEFWMEPLSIQTFVTTFDEYRLRAELHPVSVASTEEMAWGPKAYRFFVVSDDNRSTPRGFTDMKTFGDAINSLIAR